MSYGRFQLARVMSPSRSRRGGLRPYITESVHIVKQAWSFTLVSSPQQKLSHSVMLGCSIRFLPSTCRASYSDPLEGQDAEIINAIFNETRTI